MFRMVAALERAGHNCIVYLHDRHGWDARAAPRARSAPGGPGVQAEVRDLADGIEDAHAIFATGWQTAYPVLASPARGRALLLRPGLRAVVLPGRQPRAARRGDLPLRLPRRHRRPLARGAARARVRHGRRPLRLRLRPRALRARPSPAAERATGVCYYCRPSTPRRAFELAIVALELFAARHPEVDDPPVRRAGRGAAVRGHRPRAARRPSELNDALQPLRRRARSLSATNVSLVPHEMLAAGCIPVVNDAEHNRIVLDNDQVAYAPADAVRARRRAVARSSSARRPSAPPRPRRPRPASARLVGRRPGARSSGSCATSSRSRRRPLAAGCARMSRPASTSSSPATATPTLLEGCVDSVLAPGGRRRPRADRRRLLARRDAGGRPRASPPRDARVEYRRHADEPGPDRDRQRGARVGRRRLRRPALRRRPARARRAARAPSR